MILKERTKSVSHLILESLNNRQGLSSTEKIQYDNQVKGYAGEQLFDSYLRKNQPDGLFLNDLLLSTRDTYYQIDSLLITPDHIYLYEVKNYAGSYHFKDGCLFSESGHVLQDPVAQAQRKRSYLYNLLLNLNYPIEITAYVVYINPNFYIYSLPSDPSIIFSGQLPNHLKSLTRQTTASLNRHTKLAERLIQLHNENYRPDNLPSYHFEQLRKGSVCPECFSFSYKNTRQTRICKDCDCRETITESIYRSIVEFQLLFPEKALTKHYIYEWCGRDWSKARIQEVLKHHYHKHPAGRSTFYS